MGRTTLMHSGAAGSMILLFKTSSKFTALACIIAAMATGTVTAQVAAPEMPAAAETGAANGRESDTKIEAAPSLETGSKKKTDIESADEYELMMMFIDTLDEVQRNYVEPISRRELMEAAISGVLSKLDMYSNYIDQDHMDDFRREVEGEFGGIGVQIEMLRGKLTVAYPIPGSPAKVAGIRTGDQFLEVNGTSLAGKSMEQSIQMIKGPIGTEVLLKIRHDSGDEEIVKVSRGNVVMETVRSHRRTPDGEWSYMFDSDAKIGYIRITSFATNTTDELEEALSRLKSEGMKGLILDLRFNPGGLLPTAISVSDTFLSEGRIVSTEGRNVKSRKWDATKAGTFSDFPMVVLVNHYSASASEIVSACLQDNDRAVVIGERTWGKGSVQKVIELEQGKSALKLTTASYLRPSGKNIHRAPGADESEEWGVKPDPAMTVELSDRQVQRLLVAQGYSNLIPDEGDDMRSYYIDPQMKRALSYLKEKL